MPRRSILTARQRAAMIDLPEDEASILYHYTLSDADLEHIPGGSIENGILKVDRLSAAV